MRASPDPNGLHQAHAATALANLGIAPAVHDAIHTDTGTWLILDEIRPATPLADADELRATVDSLAAPLATMKNKPAPLPGMPSVIDWLRDRLEKDDVSDLSPGADRAPAQDRRAAIKVLDDLAASATPQLCHGDVSPLNVLTRSEADWVLIDPRGVSGEVEYDVAVLGFKVARRRQPTLTTGRLAEAVGVDLERTLAWAVVARAARV